MAPLKDSYAYSARDLHFEQNFHTFPQIWKALVNLQVDNTSIDS